MMMVQTMRRTIILLIVLMACASVGHAQTASITWGTTYQTIDGFGAWDAFCVNMGGYNTCGLTSTQADLFFSPTNGIGLSLLLSQVPYDGSCGTPGACAIPDVTTMQQATARGAKVVSAVWTPPASMKTNGTLNCTDGGGNGTLASSSYGAFASYLLNYVQQLQSADGISLYGLVPQEEPDSCGGAGSYTSEMSGAQIDTFVKTNIGPTFSGAGVSTKIIIPETSSTGYLDAYANPTMTDGGAVGYVGIVSSDDYCGNCGHSNEIAYTTGGKPLWQMSTSDGLTPDASMTSALTYAQMIHNWLVNVNAQSWSWWWMVDYNADTNEGLIESNGTITKRLYMMGNWSKFVRPGYVRMSATANPVSGVSCSAYKNASTGAFDIVCINTNGSSSAITFSLSGFPAVSSVNPWVTDASNNLIEGSAITVSGGGFATTLGADSVTTFDGLAGGGGTPTATLSPTNINFGPVPTGTTTSPQTVMLTNSGSATLNISSIVLAGANPTFFTLTNTGGGSCGSTLAASSSCSFTISFSPGAITSYNATVTVTSNASPTTSVLTLMGSGTTPAPPGNLYISQSGGGTGASCASPQSVAYFNNASNWTSGTPSGGQIGPGTTVQFCGTFTSTAGQQLLQVQGNGNSSLRIILNAAGATFTAPYHASSPNFGCGGAICISSYAAAHSYITLDGGGTGVIENTANGDSLTYQQPSEAIEMTNCNQCTVQNIALTNIYVHNQNGTTHAMGLDQTAERAISMQGSNLTVNNVRMVNCGWCLYNPYMNGDTNITVEFSYFQYYDHGLAFSGCAGCSFTNYYFHDNQQEDTYNWDTTGCDFHHDGIHTFGASPDGSSSISNFNVYNNVWGGNWGNCLTGFIFIERGSSTPTGMKTMNGWNNVGVVSSSNSVDTNSYWGLFESSTLYWVNNTIKGANATDNTLCTSVQYASTSVYYENNVTDTCGDPVETDNSTITTWNYNAYGPSCQNGMNCFGYHGSNQGSFSLWQSACGCDANSFQNNTLLLNASGVPQSGSPVIGAGTNLTGLCPTIGVCTDILGNARPSSGVWTMGAYQVGAAPPPAPPNGLKVISIE